MNMKQVFQNFIFGSLIFFLNGINQKNVLYKIKSTFTIFSQVLEFKEMSLSLKFFFSRSFSRDSVLFGKFRTVCETYNLEKVFQRTGYLLQPSKKNFCYFPHDANNILFCLNEQSRSYAKRAGFKKDKKDKKSQVRKISFVVLFLKISYLFSSTKNLIFKGICTKYK